MKKTTVVSGVACMLGTLLLAGGCKSQVMAEREYVPVAEESSQYSEFEATPNGSAEETVSSETMTEGPVSEEMTSESLEMTAPEAEVGAETGAVAPKRSAKTAKTPKKTAPVSYPSFESFAGKMPSTPSSAAVSGGKYVVKKGDMISRIAYTHGVSTNALLSANGLTLASAKKIRPGQTLVIPAAGSKSAVKRSSKSARKISAPKKSAASSRSAGKSVGGNVVDGYYIVKSGDNISTIALRLKVKSSALMSANNLNDSTARRLQVGQKLVVPGMGAAPVASAPVATPSYYNTTPTPSATTDKATNAALDAVDSALDTVPSESAPVTPAVTTTPATSSAVDVAANDEFIGGSTPVEVKEATKLDDFAKANGITADTFKKLNGDVVLTDGMIPAGSIVFIPTK